MIKKIEDRIWIKTRSGGESTIFIINYYMKNFDISFWSSEMKEHVKKTDRSKTEAFL